MIPKECKRLAEVDFPIAKVSSYAVLEKAGPKGHPSTLHLWWARRPLAACRAVLLAAIIPDPCDQNCPVTFKNLSREILKHLPYSLGKSDLDLRNGLLSFIGDFSNWDLGSNGIYIEAARSLVKISFNKDAPFIVDSFAV